MANLTLRQRIKQMVTALENADAYIRGECGSGFDDSVDAVMIMNAIDNGREALALLDGPEPPEMNPHHYTQMFGLSENIIITPREPAMTPTPTPQDYRPIDADRLSQVEILVPHAAGTVIVAAESYDRAASMSVLERVAALLRFGDVMTPEMWADLRYAAGVVAVTKGSAVVAALDTLRAALTKEG